ncbi:DNA sulfur modification protein DndD [Moorena producens PAL-8-15-08-1]|uniref:Nuclease SbcCD subunit C n=1 Tax=Moorena producens PAL-8-15-08-1 TaxID=1458985 RepID=A0A1D8U3U3_9CYAN|nr:DNA sulfur modification protein DndD [Moorena producens]AOX04356.1 DNA sulfur modification protein DndD [Moorena producens PAL-8-15-08-1]
MIFLELVLENFGPYLGRQVINLCPKRDDNSRPIILVGGMNGGGKTTMMDAIRLALYGHRAQCSTRGNLSYSDFLTQSVNRNALPIDNTRVELVFEHIENDQPMEYRIVRTWTKKPKDGKDNLGILEGDWLDSALTNTWDEYIENLLPLGISNLFLFDGEQVKELAEVEAPPPVVVEAIRSLLGLELADRLAIDLDILVTRKRKSMANQQQLANLEDIEKKLSSEQSDYELAKQELASIQEQLEQTREKQQQAFDKFVCDGGKIAAQRNQLESQLNHYNTKAEQIREQMRELAAGILPLSLIEPLLTQAQAQAEKESQASQAKLARDILQQRDQRLVDLLNSLKLPAKKFDKIKVFLEKENQQIEQEAGDGQDAWLGAEEEMFHSLTNLLTYYQPTQKQLAEEQLVKRQNMEADINATKRQLATAAPPESYQELENALKQAQTELAQAQAAYEIAKRRCDKLGYAIAQTKKDLARYGEETIDRKNDQHMLAASAKVQQSLKVFREQLTLRKLNKLEHEVTECFLYLLHKSDLVHRVAIDTNSFSLSLYDLQGKLVPKHRLSAGEKQLLAIALLWGLARVSGRNLPVAIDTPLGRLDSSHRSNLVERYFPAASHQVILLSTDTEIGKVEAKQLRDADAIAQQYLLNYDPAKHRTTVESGYFYSKQVTA